MQSEVTFKINIEGNVFTVIGELQGDFNQLASVVDRVDNSVYNTFNCLKNKIDNINLAPVITQVKKVAAGIKSITAPGVDFSQGVADLQSITGIADAELEELVRTARKTGRESGLGAADALGAFTTIASQIEVDDIGLSGLKELQAQAVTLAQAAGMSLDDATNALAGTINQFGFDATEASRVINVLAAGSKEGGAEIDDLAESFKVVGSQSAIAGITLEETAGALEVLSKNNIKGSEAGTHLRNIILSLQTVFGADLKKMTLSEALDQLKPKMEDATFMSQNFSRISIASAQFLVKNAEAIGEMTEKVTGTNTAYEQAEIRTDTVAQMIERCRANVDDLKIGFFELTGSAGGYAAILAEQAVMVAELLPLLSLLGKGIGFITSATKLQALWAGIVKVATVVWTGVQWAFNAALWACPLTWIVAAIAALIAVIVLCVTKVQGWGAQWESITNFMKLTGQLFVKTIKFEFQTMVNGIMIGLDYIKLGWYKFKAAVGIGDSAENEAMIGKIGADIENRKNAIVDGAKELADLAKQAAGALTWELSWKKKDKGEEEGNGINVLLGDQSGNGKNHKSGLQLNLNGKGGKGGGSSGSGSPSVLDLNNVVPNLKGSTSYSAIASRMLPIRAAAITAAASVALPVAVETMTLPQRDPDHDPRHTEYIAETRPPAPDALVMPFTSPLTKAAAIMPVALPAAKETAAIQPPAPTASPTAGESAAVPVIMPIVPPIIKETAAIQPSAPVVSPAAGETAAVQVIMPIVPPIIKETAAIQPSSPTSLPFTREATALPQRSPELDLRNTDYTAEKRSQSISMPKFCDKLEIHIASADEKGYQQIKTEIAKVLTEVFDDYGA